MNTNNLIKMLKRPELYSNGTDNIWTNPYIANNMLEAHLEDSHDAASYRTKKREEIIDYIIATANLSDNSSLVDFGCGVGLYVSKFTELGIATTGIDFSENSIKYARIANRDNKNCNFVHADYTMPLEITKKHDVALLVSEDYGVLSEDSRYNLLSNINGFLATGGYFFFDIASYSAYENVKAQTRNTWSVSDVSFYRPHEHLMLETDYFYDKERVSCKSVLIIDDEIQIYRIYQTYFSIEKITKELKDSGFKIQEVLSSLDGGEYSEISYTLGLVCRKI